MFTYFCNFLSVISSVHEVESEGAKHCTCGLGTLSPSLPHQTNVDPESCPRIPCKTIFLCEIPAWKNRQLYKSLAVVIYDLLNFRAIVPPPRRSRSLFWRHLSLSLRKARLEGKPKEEKRKATFSFLYFGFPSSPARAPCSSPTLRTKVHAPCSLLLKKKLRIIACQQTFFSFIFFVLFCFL